MHNSEQEEGVRKKPVENLKRCFGTNKTVGIQGRAGTGSLAARRQTRKAVTFFLNTVADDCGDNDPELNGTNVSEEEEDGRLHGNGARNGSRRMQVLSGVPTRADMPTDRYSIPEKPANLIEKKRGSLAPREWMRVWARSRPVPRHFRKQINSSGKSLKSVANNHRQENRISLFPRTAERTRNRECGM